MAAALLGLQIIGGLEYTEGGSLYTRASMIAAMVTLATLPVFIEAARSLRAYGLVVALGVSFVAFLAYSLPATTGRTGEIKETKVLAANDIALAKAELESITKTLSWAMPDKISECAGAPVPLPPKGWPRCRQKTGTVTALADRQKKLEEITNVGTQAQMGDLGSEIWASALGFLGVTASIIRKGSVMAFAIGLDVVIWSLIWFATTAFAAGRPAVATQQAITERPQGEPTDREIEELRRLLAKAKAPLTNNGFKELAGCSKGEASKRADKAVAAGVITKRRIGRQVFLELTPAGRMLH